MSQPAVQLTSASPISSVAMIDSPTEEAALPKTISSEPDIQKIIQAVQALDQAALDLQESASQVFSSHREQLIRLSIEIAAKVLAKDVHERNYEIEKILTQALEEVPTGQPVTVKLNPEDFQTCQKALEQGSFKQPDRIQLVSDGTIDPGQCTAQTEQGVIEWIVDEHLNRISEALLGNAKTDE